MRTRFSFSLLREEDPEELISGFLDRRKKLQEQLSRMKSLISRFKEKGADDTAEEMGLFLRIKENLLERIDLGMQYLSSRYKFAKGAMDLAALASAAAFFYLMVVDLEPKLIAPTIWFPMSFIFLRDELIKRKHAAYIRYHNNVLDSENRELEKLIFEAARSLHERDHENLVYETRKMVLKDISFLSDF